MMHIRNSHVLVSIGGHKVDSLDTLASHDVVEHNLIPWRLKSGAARVLDLPDLYVRSK